MEAVCKPGADCATGDSLKARLTESADDKISTADGDVTTKTKAWDTKADAFVALE